jgi:hypothetical protein
MNYSGLQALLLGHYPVNRTLTSVCMSFVTQIAVEGDAKGGNIYRIYMAFGGRAEK